MGIKTKRNHQTEGDKTGFMEEMILKGGSCTGRGKRWGIQVK